MYAPPGSYPSLGQDSRVLLHLVKGFQDIVHIALFAKEHVLLQ